MGRFDSFFTDDEAALPENAPIEVNSVPYSNQNNTTLIPLKSQNGTNTAQNKPQTTNTEPDSATSAPDSTSAAFTLLSEESAPVSEQDSIEGVTTSEVTTQATLPADIASRPQTAMKARYSGHALFNDLVRRDWQLAIAADPFAFDALLYVPTDSSATETDPDAGGDDHDEPAYTEINTNQKTLTYGDPVKVAVLDCPDERPEFSASDNDGDLDGGIDDVLILRIAPPLEVIDANSDEEADHPIIRAFVPVGSILEWNEALADGSESRSWWYVHRIFTYGTASVGSLYYCIPARNYDAVMEATSE
ncbi:phage tail protein [Pantoea sp. LMR881]|uniref:phage tail protein n=1 Tax=Pantoea sp. LMR881 TaxID=3014336 RepID=UPI0022AEB13D|nr:phage tail protein [Pantoea sp. LMR881]MCZ4061170.1 phage tail protein [Pantoea sp. LMR881]MCZ4061283.1 phage tail protein [Pantoea sp. LMR881]